MKNKSNMALSLIAIAISIASMIISYRQNKEWNRQYEIYCKANGIEIIK